MAIDQLTFTPGSAGSAPAPVPKKVGNCVDCDCAAYNKGSDTYSQCTIRPKSSCTNYCVKCDANAKYVGRTCKAPAPALAPVPKPVPPPPAPAPPAPMRGGPAPSPVVASAPCGFESATTPYCKTWTNAKGDQFDWTRRSGSTPSCGTGPSKAHSGNHYLYIEAS